MNTYFSPSAREGEKNPLVGKTLFKSEHPPAPMKIFILIFNYIQFNKYIILIQNTNNSAIQFNDVKNTI